MATHARFFELIKSVEGYSKEHRDMIKESLVYDFSDKKTQSLSEMYKLYPKAYSTMIEWLETNARKHTATDSAAVKLALKAGRSKILKLLTEIGVNTTAAALGDWTPVNSYLMSPKIAGKTLDKMSLAEIEECRVKLQSIKTKEQRRMAELKRLERLN